MNAEFDHLFKVLLLGDSGVGKSSIILRYTDDKFSPTLMNSIGVDFKLKNVEIEGRVVRLQIWDTAGQERFRTITTSYYRGAHAIAIIYDITDRESFDHVKNWMMDIEKFAKENVLKFLVGNKLDLKDKRKVTEEEGKELAKLYNIPFVETSAKDSTNIDDLFNNSVQNFIQKVVVTGRKNSLDLKKRNTLVIDIDKTEEKKSEDSCCLK